MRTIVARVAALSLALAAGGCEQPWEKALREARAVEADLAPARTKGRPMWGIHTRIVVRADGIGVDQADLVASWPRELRAELGPRAIAAPRAQRLRAFVPTSGDPRSLLLPQLHVALQKAVRLEKEIGLRDSERSFDGAVEVDLARDAPYGIVAKVLYTAGQAEYSRWHLRLRGRTDSPVGLEIEAPRIGHDPDHGPTCAAPIVEMGTTGILVTAGSDGPPRMVNRAATAAHADLAKAMDQAVAGVLRDSAVGSAAIPAPPPAVPAAPPSSAAPVEPAWMGAVMLGPAGACPSVPLRDGRHDLPALLSLLREMERMAPGCRGAVVSTADATRFEDLAGVLETVQVESPFGTLQLGLVMDVAPPRCEGGVRPGG